MASEQSVTAAGGRAAWGAKAGSAGAQVIRRHAGPWARLAAGALLLVCLAGCDRAGGSRAGAPLSADDKLFLRRNTPPEVATWVLTDDGTTAIAGANFDFEPKNFQALAKDFTVEDYTNR